MLNIGNDVMGGHFGKLHNEMLGIANRSEAKKAQDRIFNEEKITRLHLDAHKEDMMRSMYKVCEDGPLGCRCTSYHV